MSALTDRRAPASPQVLATASLRDSRADCSFEGSAAVNRLYVVAAWVPRRETIVVGALGPITFTRGWYAYVGSARRGRDARVARHMRPDKPVRWHADYLFSRHPATRSWLFDTELTECDLAALLRRQSANEQVQPLARFGASDCGCEGHMVGVRPVDVAAVTRRITSRVAWAAACRPTFGPESLWPGASGSGRDLGFRHG